MPAAVDFGGMWMARGGGDEVSKAELMLPQASESTEMGMRSSPPCPLHSHVGASDDGGAYVQPAAGVAGGLCAHPAVGRVSSE